MKLDNFFKILTVDEVASFGKAQRNRQISIQHVNDFLTIIKNTKYVKDDDGTYLIYGIIPIIVNPLTNHVMDGQHKLEAVKRAYELGIIDENARILVGYWPVENEDEENRIIIMLNTKSKNWSMEDYMTAYSKYIDSYSRLKEFCEKHPLCIEVKKNGKQQYKYRYAASMITGKREQSALKSGGFNFTDAEYNLASKIHDELLEIRKKIGLPLSGTDIEDMACEWHTQRQFMTVDEIKSLAYLPVGVRNNQVWNKSGWRKVFALVKDSLQKTELKKKVA